MEGSSEEPPNQTVAGCGLCAMNSTCSILPSCSAMCPRWVITHTPLQSKKLSSREGKGHSSPVLSNGRWCWSLGWEAAWPREHPQGAGQCRSTRPRLCSPEGPASLQLLFEHSPVFSGRARSSCCKNSIWIVYSLSTTLGVPGLTPQRTKHRSELGTNRTSPAPQRDPGVLVVPESAASAS